MKKLLLLLTSVFVTLSTFSNPDTLGPFRIKLSPTKNFQRHTLATEKQMLEWHLNKLLDSLKTYKQVFDLASDSLAKLQQSTERCGSTLFELAESEVQSDTVFRELEKLTTKYNDLYQLQEVQTELVFRLSVPIKDLNSSVMSFREKLHQKTKELFNLLMRGIYDTMEPGTRIIVSTRGENKRQLYEFTF